MGNIQNYINGEFVNPIKNNWIDNYNPSIGKVCGQIPNSTKEDVEIGYLAAAKAFPKWSNTTLAQWHPRDRIRNRADCVESCVVVDAVHVGQAGFCGIALGVHGFGSKVVGPMPKWRPDRQFHAPALSQ